jgi:LmbE family N-acetylglucosaminyl deacetylase
MKPRVLVLAAHPDDAELGAGGLLAESKRAAVFVAGAADQDRLAEAEAAARALGARLYSNEIPDGRFSEHEGRLIRAIEAVVEEVGPTLVAVPPAADTHQDHRALHAAALSALRRSPVSIVEYETPSVPHGWGPDYFVPIGADTVDAVEETLTGYRTQDGALYLAPGSYRARTRAAGIRVGSVYAEPYRTVKLVAPAR